jgi:hypothetical protein
MTKIWRWLDGWYGNAAIAHARHVNNTHIEPSLCWVKRHPPPWRAIHAIACHATDNRLQPSCLEINVVLRRGKQYLPGPTRSAILPATSSTRVLNPSVLT